MLSAPAAAQPGCWPRSRRRAPASRSNPGAWTDLTRKEGDDVPARCVLFVGADFARAFPREAAGGRVPLAAIALSADGDSAGASSVSCFDDVVLDALP